MNNVLPRILAALHDAKRELAEGVLDRPSENVKDFYVISGRWQGLEQARQIIDAVLRDDEEQEATR